MGPGDRPNVCGTHMEGGPLITPFPVCILMGKEMLSLPLTETLATGQTSGEPGGGLSLGRECTGVCACVQPAPHASVALWGTCSVCQLQAGKRALGPGPWVLEPGSCLPRSISSCSPGSWSPGSCLPRSIFSRRSAEDASDTVSSDSHGQATAGTVTVSLLAGGGLLSESLAEDI